MLITLLINKLQDNKIFNNRYNNCMIKYYSNKQERQGNDYFNSELYNLAPLEETNFFWQNSDLLDSDL